jgi:ABC-2 type transport system ATP-binding protein
VRRKVGYLSGDTPLYPEMRVDRFLTFIGQARGLRGDGLKKQLDWVIGVCGLEEVLLKRILRCSTGFRQRIGLASALIHDPPILLLDEPTHGFDPLQLLAFRDLLRNLSPGRAILFSTHIIQEVVALSDRVLIIHNGRLMADGRPRELAEAAGLSSDRLEDLFAHLIRQSEERKPSHA